MAYNIHIPFRAFQLTLLSSDTFVTPLADMKSIRIKEALHQVSGKYAEAFQQSILNKGGAATILNIHPDKVFEKETITIFFPAANNGYSYPDFELTFDYYYQSSDKGYQAILPVLAIEVYAPDAEKLEQHLKESIQTDFKRNKRLQNVQDILSVVWYEASTLLSDRILLRALIPEEVQEQEIRSQKKLLPEVATPCFVGDVVLYKREEQLSQLLQFIKNEFNRNVLLVGPSGVGKSALIRAASQRLHETNFPMKIWETTASRMLKELMRDTAWQDNLSTLCEELRSDQQILFVRNFMELFEVGQYEGNDVSLAEYLRSYISRGVVFLISECTEEELAAIELRSPNYSDQFNIIRLANPKKGLKEIVLNRANDLSRAKKVQLSEEAIQEVIRLNLRYTPYSGLPGKPIRFIENLLLETKQNKSLVRSDIIEHFCEETGMPTFMVDPSIPMDVEAVEQRFNKNVFGQVEAVRKVVSILASVKAALTRKEKPIASFLFVGPTGVGKTELAKVLAEFMFNDRERMLRFDMSEYSNPVSLSRLIGSSFGSDGTLTAAVRRTPFSVLLFDEIEKADYKFYDLLLQILSEGRLTDNQGKLVNFCSTIIIMTSNIGASRPAPIALGNSEAAESVAQHYLSAVQKHFRPELFGRIDEVIPFLPLSQAVVREVVKREIELFRKREGIHFRPIQLDIAAPVLDHLASVGYDSKYGARHLQRSLRDELILPLSKQLNFESGDDHLQIEVRLDEQQKITITVTADPMGFDRYMEQWDKQVNADHASELRRKMETLQDGLRYIELKDELMRMERIKLRRKEEFWQNKYYAKRYPSYLTCQQNIQALAQKVEQLETNLSLSYLDLGPYQTAPEEQLSAWEKSFSGIKKELYRTLQPESDFCHLAVYGTHLQSIVHFYSELFRLKAFEYELESIHYDEAHYEDQLALQELEKKQQELYIKTIVKDNDFEQVVQKNLYGVVFHVRADAVLLYLRQEQGLHKWNISEETEHLYAVSVDSEKQFAPESLHRRDFYRGKPVIRTHQVHLLSIQDSVLGVKKTYKKGRFNQLMLEYMDTAFEEQLDRLLM